MPIIGSFADIAGQWLESEKHKVTTVTHTKKTARLKNLAFPVLGDMPIKQIKPSDV
ncbi:MAG: integrase, partial [Methylococcaceae bacterium]|nr:integrase [Methylococcaceae bacterium]